MSHIPSNVMKHAGAPASDGDEKASPKSDAKTGGSKNEGTGRLAQLKDKARANPKTTAAAAGLVAIGLAAAAAIPAVKARKGASAKSTKTKAKTARTTKKSAAKS